MRNAIDSGKGMDVASVQFEESLLLPPFAHKHYFGLSLIEEEGFGMTESVQWFLCIMLLRWSVQPLEEFKFFL